MRAGTQSERDDKMDVKRTGSYLSREESFMYDKETKFPLEATNNAARVEYMRNGLTFTESRRCKLSRISRSGAIIEFSVDAALPDAMTLDIPDARIEKIGCVKAGERRTTIGEKSVNVTLRFLRMLSEKELASIKQHSLLPNGQPQRMPNVVLGN
jgi:hypothetical protein